MTNTQEEGLKIMTVENMRLVELARSIKKWHQVLVTSINEADVTNDFVRISMNYDRATFSRILTG